MATTPLPVSLNTTVGALVIGSWVNCFFYALELAQLWFYLHEYRDRASLVVVVFFAVFVDTVGTVGECAWVYLVAVTHWGNDEYLLLEFWPVTVFLLTTSISSVITQTFLIHRYYVLTQQRLVPILLYILMSTGLSADVIISVKNRKDPRYEDRSSSQLLVSLWILSSVLTDVGIAVALVIKLNRIETSMQATRHLLTKLKLMTIQTGAATAAISLVTFIVFQVDHMNNVSVGMLFSIGRIYTITLLYNLNQRKKNKLTLQSEPSAKSSEGHPIPSNIRFIQANVAHSIELHSASSRKNTLDLRPLLENCDDYPRVPEPAHGGNGHDIEGQYTITK